MGTSVLDDLSRHLDDQKFAYLLSALSWDDSTTSSTKSHEGVYSECETLTDSQWSGSSSMKRQTKKQRGPIRMEDKAPTQVSPVFPSFKHTSSCLPISMSAERGRPNVLLQLSSTDTSTSRSSKESMGSISKTHYSAGSRDSIMAVHCAPVACAISNSDGLQTLPINRSFSVLPIMPMSISSQRRGQEDSAGFYSITDCNHLPVCQRLLKKFASVNKRHSLSSSVESVLANSIPDVDTPFSKIAGKISNEPSNPFPILRTEVAKKSSRALKGSKGSSFLASNRIEGSINKELRRLQDYKDVNELFSKAKKCDTKSKSSNKVSVSCLARQITNPLYKRYDPAGYQKSEDELAKECVQMVCDDFNEWIKSLSTNHISRQDKAGHDTQSKEEEQKTHVIIGPELLLQILRKELELPEKPDE